MWEDEWKTKLEPGWKRNWKKSTILKATINLPNAVLQQELTEYLQTGQVYLKRIQGKTSNLMTPSRRQKLSSSPMTFLLSFSAFSLRINSRNRWGASQQMMAHTCNVKFPEATTKLWHFFQVLQFFLPKTRKISCFYLLSLKKT